MAPGNDAQIERQPPAFGQDAARFGMIEPEFLALEIQDVEALLGRAADDALIFRRIGDQQREPANIMHDTGGKRDVCEGIAGLRDLFGQHRCSNGVLPATPEFGGSQGALCVCGRRMRDRDLPGPIQPHQSDRLLHVADWIRQPKFVGVNALQQAPGKGSVGGDKVRYIFDFHVRLGEQCQESCRDGWERRYFLQTSRDDHRRVHAQFSFSLPYLSDQRSTLCRLVT